MGRLGLSADDVHDTLRAALAGREAGHIYEDNRRFDVLVRLGEQQQDVEGLARPPLPCEGFLPLGAVARPGTGKGSN